MALVVSKAVVDVPLSTTAYLRPQSLPWHKQTLLQEMVLREPIQLLTAQLQLRRVPSQLAKTVKLPSRHFGDETTLVTSSATLVVSFATCIYVPAYLRVMTNPIKGLYYKLHGKHRPVAMKKQEIKRRKRVVPAGDGGSQVASSVADYSPPQRPSQTPAFDHSVSPDPSTALESREEYTPEPPRGPIPVDFTTYYSNPPATSNPAALVPNMQPSAPSPRKRSRSATIDPEDNPAHPMPHRPNAISSILNPSQIGVDANIDPSLSVPLRPSAGTSPNPGMSQEEKVARKERLQREAEAMRQELERRQKELDELEHD
jgi:hypothetical protein